MYFRIVLSPMLYNFLLGIKPILQINKKIPTIVETLNEFHAHDAEQEKKNIGILLISRTIFMLSRRDCEDFYNIKP